MAKKPRLLGALADLGIIDIEDTASAPAPVAAATPAASSAPPSVMPSVSQSTSVDVEMVAKIRAAVTAATHAPRLTSFLSNLVTARLAFPGDEKSAVNAALAFSKLTSADLRDELAKAVAAALIEAEGKIKKDVGQQREQLTADLDTQAAQHRDNIAALQGQIKTLQEKLGTAETALSEIDTTRKQKTDGIDRLESTALASLAAVKAELDSISRLLP